MPLFPRRLTPGDTLGIVAPASAPPAPDAIDQCIHAVESLGFRPKLAPNVRKRWGFLAGMDHERASDLMAMFTNPKVRGIICVRGGYGTSRLLHLLDYSLIRNNPKTLIGYSDITSLHCALFKNADLVTLHGPMLNSDFLKPNVPAFTKASLLRALTNPVPHASICEGYSRQTISVLHEGVAQGRLIGGNLSLLCAALGTPYFPPLKKAIFFFEDLDEVPYRLDRMLTQLLNAGRLQNVAGIAVGILKNCKDPKARKAKEYRQSVHDVLCERLLPLKVPIVAGLPFGHVPYNATIPFGSRAVLDADNANLWLEEPGVA